MDIERINDMYFARQIIECESYRRLAFQQCLPDDAAAANEELRAAAQSGTLANLVEADVQFHRTLIAQLASARISRVHESLINEMRLCLVQVQAYELLDPSIIADEHASILTAIGAGEPDVAADRGQAPLEHAHSKLVGYLAEQS